MLQGAPPEAPGQQAPSSPFGGYGSWIPILLVLVIFYMVLVLPERKKQKKRQAMLGALKKGDKVMTSGGLYGQVAQVTNEVVVLQVADGVRLRFARVAIQTVVTEEPGEKPAEAETAKG